MIDLESYSLLEEKGVFIHYSPEHCKDGTNTNFSIEFIPNRDEMKRTQTGWYNDNHEFGNTSQTMIASVKIAFWYLEDSKRIQLINSGYHNPEYVKYIKELSDFLKTIII